MQRLLRECDIIIIAIAFVGSSCELRGLVIESLSKGQQEILAEVINLIGQPSVAQIIDSQNDILRIVKELRISQDVMN